MPDTTKYTTSVVIDTTKYSILLLCMLVLISAMYCIFAVGRPIAKIQTTLDKHTEVLAIHTTKLELLGVYLKPETILRVKEKLDETKRNSTENH